MMEKSTLSVIAVVFSVVLYQVAVWPLLFTVSVFCVVTCTGLYMLVANGTLLPIEGIIMDLYSKVSGNNLQSQVSKEEVLQENLNDTTSIYDDEITRKLRELTGHIVRDFILDWYNTVSDNVEFVQEAFEVFEHVLTEVRSRVTAINSQTFVRVLLYRLKRHYTCYKQAMDYAQSVNNTDSTRKEQTVVVTYEKLNGHLAMSNLPDTESDHLRSLTAILLKGLLPSDYKLTGTSMYLVRELISSNVMLAVVDMATKPDWINTMIIRVLEDDIEDESGSSTYSSSSGSVETLDVEDDAQNYIVLPPTPESSVHEEEPVTSQPTEPSVRYSVSFDKNTVEIDLPTHTYTDTGHKNTLEFQSEHLNTIQEDQEDSEPIEVDTELAHFSDSGEGSDKNVDKNFNKHTKLPTVASDDFNLPAFPPRRPRYFRHIRIHEAVTVDEAFEGGGRYTLYKITYFAPPHKDINKRRTSNFNLSNSSSNTMEADLKEFQVQRRFREFLTLQDRLNENQKVRKLMTKIRGPSRMFPMPIGNLDKQYIEKRRKLLQAFMRELCSYPEISETVELRQFLAYTTDPRIAFVRKSSEYIPRFDKMFKNAFHELIGAASHKFSDKFSLEQDDVYIQPHTQLSASKSMPILNEHKPSCSSHRSTHTKHKGPVTRFKNIMLGKTLDSDKYEDVVRDYSPFTGPRNPNLVTFGRKWRSPENLLTNRTRFCASSMGGRRTQGDGCDNVISLEQHGNGLLGDCILAGQVFRAAKIIWNIPLGKHSLSVVCVARFVQQYMEMKIQQLLQKDKWMHYLKTFQNSLWPSGVWGETDAKESKDPKENYEKAQLVLEDTFPDVLRLLVGDTEYKQGVSSLLESFQHPVINRHLIYHLLDSSLQLLFPDFQNILAKRRNISI
ncbi:sorting nexin-19 [Ciona intestinalis]